MKYEMILAESIQDKRFSKADQLKKPRSVHLSKDIEITKSMQNLKLPVLSEELRDKQMNADISQIERIKARNSYVTENLRSAF